MIVHSAVLSTPYDRMEHFMKNSNLRVLIVDDELDIRVVLADLLSMQGYEVMTAQDGIDALKQMANGLPDVIMSDLRMPVMSGYEFMSVLRRRFPQIPVIAVSGEYRKGEMPSHIPADAYLSKGDYRIEELCKVILELSCAYPIRPAGHVGGLRAKPVPIGADGNLILQCTTCLRPFQVEARGMNGGLHAASCASCQTFISFEIDHSQDHLILQSLPSLFEGMALPDSTNETPLEQRPHTPSSPLNGRSDRDS